MNLLELPNDLPDYFENPAPTVDAMVEEARGLGWISSCVGAAEARRIALAFMEPLRARGASA